MAYSTKLSISLHLLLALVRFSSEEKQTSIALADSIQVNPVIVRNLLQKLKKAELVTVDKGIGGAYLAKNPKDFTLYDVFIAVEDKPNPLLKQHQDPNPQCPLGKTIHRLITPHFDTIQEQTFKQMKAIRFQELVDDMLASLD